MSEPVVFATIPAHRPALTDVRECIDAIGLSPEHVIVVANGPDPIRPDEVNATVVIDPQATGRDDINISRWWNVGLDAAATIAPHTTRHVLVLNADARTDPLSIAAMSKVLDEQGAAVAYPDVHNHLQSGWCHMQREAREVDLFWRMSGYCFMVNSQSGVMADERFRWWYGDDDLDWTARVNGGSVMVGDAQATHPAAGGTDEYAMAEVIRADRRAFIEKWHRAPHPFGAEPNEDWLIRDLQRADSA